MKITVGMISLATLGTFAQTPKIVMAGEQVQLQWDRHFPLNSGVTSWWEYRVLTSSDLSAWSEHSLIRSDDSEGAGVSTLDLPRGNGSQFFRLRSQLFYSHRESSDSQPAFYEQQYDSAFNPELTLTEFADQSSDPSCLEGINRDPTTATFFTEFNTTPQAHNVSLPADDPERRVYDFALNENELAKFQQNGFVVSPRVKAYKDFWDEGHLIAPTPVDLYYAIWTDDLPVFITADSVLDAWHQSFQAHL